MTHTQGPWTTYSQQHCVEIYERTSFGRGQYIGSVAFPPGDEQGHTGAANAKLIAAAPDLLAAVEAILFQVVQGKVLERDACINQARAALKKAIGG